MTQSGGAGKIVYGYQFHILIVGHGPVSDPANTAKPIDRYPDLSHNDIFLSATKILNYKMR
jgi:hypothetical protein